MNTKQCTFGELKAGDNFRFNGDTYEKISGNTADEVSDSGEIIATIEFDATTVVDEIIE